MITRIRTSLRRDEGASAVEYGLLVAAIAAIIVAMAVLLVRMPSSFLPEEDQGIVLIQAVLPAGATQERTVEVLKKAGGKEPITAAIIGGDKEYKARHILVEKEDQAKALLAQLKKGAKFEDLAKKQSKDPGSGANGGDLDWAAGGNYVKEFSEAMVALKKGQLTDKPVKTQFGWHVIRLDDVREAQLPKFEEVKPQITQQLTQAKLAKYQDDLRAKAKVQ